MALLDLPISLIFSVPSYILQLVRAVIPKRISATPLLLLLKDKPDGSAKTPTLQDGSAHIKHILIDQVENTEDLLIWPADKVAILSTDKGRPSYNAFTGEGDRALAGDGSLKVLNLIAPSDDHENKYTTLHDLTIEGWPQNRPFHPLGINCLETANTSTSVPGQTPAQPQAHPQEAILAVANCMPSKCAIEIIKLVYLRSSGKDSANNSDSPEQHPQRSSSNKNGNDDDDGGEAPASCPIKATFLFSIEHKSITAPNALVILSFQQDNNGGGSGSETESESGFVQVLFTNSFGAPPRTSRLLNTLEQFVAYPGGSVNLLTAHEKGSKVDCYPVIKNVALANGLALNADRRILAVASSTAHYVKIYDVADLDQGVQVSVTGETETKTTFKWRRTMHVGMLADNLRFHYPPSPSGTDTSATQTNKAYGPNDKEILLCAGHPNALQFVATAKNPKKPYRSPSMAVKIIFPKNAPKVSLSQNIKDRFAAQASGVTTIFQSLGSFYGTSSTAAAYTDPQGKPQVLICGLFEKGLLLCDDVDLSTE